MKYVLSPWIMELANKCSKVPGMKKMLKPFYYNYKKKLERKRNQNFQHSSLTVLSAFDECMQINNIPYTLIFGSLLGAVREHGFIKHDLDIDVAIHSTLRSEKLYNAMQKAGFSLIHRFIIEDGSLGCEDTFEYKDTGVTIDIFYIYPAIDQFTYCCCWNNAEGCTTLRESIKKIGGVYPRRIEQPIGHQYIRVPFEQIEVSITSNAHECLAFAYGNDYMIPDPNYQPPTTHRYIWYEKIAKVEIYKK